MVKNGYFSAVFVWKKSEKNPDCVVCSKSGKKYTEKTPKKYPYFYMNTVITYVEYLKFLKYFCVFGTMCAAACGGRVLHSGPGLVARNQDLLLAFFLTNQPTQIFTQ